MSSPHPHIEPYVRPEPTKEDLEYAPLAALDVSKVPDWNKSDGKEELVNDLRRAIEEVGFFYVVGHGIDDLDVRRQLALGKYWTLFLLLFVSLTCSSPKATPSSSSPSKRSSSTHVTLL